MISTDERGLPILPGVEWVEVTEINPALDWELVVRQHNSSRQWNFYCADYIWPNDSLDDNPTYRFYRPRRWRTIDPKTFVLGSSEAHPVDFRVSYASNDASMVYTGRGYIDEYGDLNGVSNPSFYLHSKQLAEAVLEIPEEPPPGAVLPTLDELLADIDAGMAGYIREAIEREYGADRCGLCGSPTNGAALIDGVPYCHRNPGIGLSCYEKKYSEGPDR